MDTPNYITILLTQGQVTIVSLEDADLAECKWLALKSPKYHNENTFRVNRYVKRGMRNYTKEYLHRVIMARMLNRELTKDDVVDHISGDTLDNRRSNLRLATHQQNMCNRGARKGSKSGYKGVSWDKSVKGWKANIYVNGKRHYLGLFKDPKIAYDAYCKAAIELHGEFARLK